jgi:predicted ribosomally synthesized peptide with nif11-like leader
MSVENVKAFFKKLETDEAFREEFAKSELIEKGNQESILKAAEAKGYSFTMDDLKQAQEEHKDSELSEDDLDKVNGGVLYGACLFYGYGHNCYDTDADGKDEVNRTGGAWAVCLGLGMN